MLLNQKVETEILVDLSICEQVTRPVSSAMLRLAVLVGNIQICSWVSS